jgi:hypothetical protein
MQEQLVALTNRIEALETAHGSHLEQTNSIKADTTELLETFNALKGAWTVLNAIGKLAKPLTFIATLYGAWWAFKNGTK